MSWTEEIDFGAGFVLLFCYFYISKQLGLALYSQLQMLVTSVGLLTRHLEFQTKL